jgi:hypothetical protein
VPDWNRIEACSIAHLPQVSSLAFDANALSSFSKFSCVKTGASAGGITGGFVSFDLAFELPERAMMHVRGCDRTTQVKERNWSYQYEIPDNMAGKSSELQNPKTLQERIGRSLRSSLKRWNFGHIGYGHVGLPRIKPTSLELNKSN